MFEGISEKLNTTLKKVRGYGKLSEDNIQESLREVRLSLLEADVNFKVVRDFVESVKNRALGQEVMQSLSPGQQFVKIVHEELINVLGSESSELDLKSSPPVGIMLIGLQGSGKTTTMEMLSHEKLDVYQCSIELFSLVTEIIQHIPRGYSYIADQLHRAALDRAVARISEVKLHRASPQAEPKAAKRCPGAPRES